VEGAASFSRRARRDSEARTEAWEGKVYWKEEGRERGRERW